MSRLCLLAFLASAAGLGQVGYPGQYPGSGPYPGSSPRSQYPGSGIPMPGRHKKSKDGQNGEDLKRDKGRITEVAADHLNIETADHREITYAVTKETKVLDANEPATFESLAVGQTVWVGARVGEREDFTAVNIQIVEKAPATVVSQAPKDSASEGDDSGPPKLRRAPAEQASTKPQPTPEETAETPTTIVENAPKDTPVEADDGQRPVLRRGQPAAVKQEAKTSAAPVRIAAARTKPAPVPEAEARPTTPEADAPATPGKAVSTNEFLEKAREIAEEFTQGLPNFTCMEMVTRFFTEAAHGVSWEPIDVISTKVVYEGGKESYQDTTVGGKKADPVKSGSWSYGEFGTVLAGLFSPGVGARFTYAHDSDMNGFTAKMFNLEVDRPRSNWTIHEGGQTFQPAYKGSVWIDRSTYRVIRLEMQAVQIPKEFPLDTAEMTLDYQYVRLGTGKFLVPVHSEVLACHRGSPRCDKNAIDFRNYKKFGSESDITFGQ